MTKGLWSLSACRHVAQKEGFLLRSFDSFQRLDRVVGFLALERPRQTSAFGCLDGARCDERGGRVRPRHRRLVWFLFALDSQKHGVSLINAVERANALDGRVASYHVANEELRSEIARARVKHHTKDLLPSVAVLVRTYRGDVQWLMYSLRSVEKFVRPYVESVTVVYPAEDEEHVGGVLRAVFPWARTSAIRHIPFLEYR